MRDYNLKISEDNIQAIQSVAATFLGHNSWFLQTSNVSILIDPILLDKIGSYSDFRVYPPRNVNLDLMPQPNYVLLTHEHSDHFHPPSLLSLPKSVKVLVGDMMPNFVVDYIKTECGLSVERVPMMEKKIIGDLEFELYPVGPETVFWEQRVTQFCVAPLSSKSVNLFFAVDALVSPYYVEDIRHGRRIKPTSLFVSNNSQIPAPGAIGALDNASLGDRDRYRDITGLSILKEVLIDYARETGEVENIVVCGGGVMKPGDVFGKNIFSDQNELAALANMLTSRGRAWGPLPGNRLVFNFSGEITLREDVWVNINLAELSDLDQQLAQLFECPRKARISPQMIGLSFAGREEEVLEAVEVALRDFAWAILTSELAATMARSAHSRREYRPTPFVLLLNGWQGGNSYQYVLNFSTASFVHDSTPYSEVMTRFPFGLEMFFCDFVALIEGKVQIWDLAGTALRSWYMGDPVKGIVPFLYAYFGEITQPELSSRVLLGNQKILSAR